MKQGLFNHSDLTVRFGGALSIPKNIFTAKAIKVPEYTLVTYEKECLGNGWYSTGPKIRTEKRCNNSYLIIYENKVIGYMNPYFQGDIKSFLLDIQEAPKQVKDFAKTINT